MRARVDGVRGRPGVGRYEKEKAGGAGGRRRYSRGQGTLVARGSEREREMEGEGGGRGECPSRCGRYNSEFCLCPVTIWPPRQRTWATPPPPLTKHPALSCARRRPPLCNFTPACPATDRGRVGQAAPVELAGRAQTRPARAQHHLLCSLPARSHPARTFAASLLPGHPRTPDTGRQPCVWPRVIRPTNNVSVAVDSSPAVEIPPQRMGSSTGTTAAPLGISHLGDFPFLAPSSTALESDNTIAIRPRPRRFHDAPPRPSRRCSAPMFSPARPLRCALIRFCSSLSRRGAVPYVNI